MGAVRADPRPVLDDPDASTWHRGRPPRVLVAGDEPLPAGCDCVVVRDPDRADALVALGGRGLDGPGFAEIRARLAGRPLVVIVDDAVAADLKLVRGLLAQGASAVVAASLAPGALQPAVRAAVEGHLVVPAVARALLGRPSFTVREKQILGMVVLGFSNAEIAAKLFVAETTVKSHLSSVFAKLGVRSRRDAAEAILDPANGLGTGVLAIVGDDHEEA